MDYTKLAIAGGILFAAWKFAPNAIIKGGALSIAAVIIAKQIPYVNEVM